MRSSDERYMKRSKYPLKSRKLGVSYTISAVIMTATAITLTLVAWSYANQTLEQQRGATEFDVAMESILAFNDAFENIAWKPQSSRSARFIVEYGQLQLIPNMDLVVNVTDYSGASYSGSTGYLRYSIKTKYVSFVEGYHTNFLGNDNFISSGAGSYAKGTISQDSSWVSMDLIYGVRIMKSSTVATAEGTVNNVDIWIIEMNTTAQSTSFTEFDLNARCLDVKTETRAYLGDGYPAHGGCTVAVQFGGDVVDSTTIDLDGDKVVFHFIIASVQVTL
jgi:hypothetical protein